VFAWGSLALRLSELLTEATLLFAYASLTVRSSKLRPEMNLARSLEVRLGIA